VSRDRRANFFGKLAATGGKNSARSRTGTAPDIDRQPDREPRPAGREPRPAGTGPRPVGTGRGPALSGQKIAAIRQKSALRAAPPTRCRTGARAMFLTNNHVKNDMNVSRETLPIICANTRGLLTD